MKNQLPDEINKAFDKVIEYVGSGQKIGDNSEHRRKVIQAMCQELYDAAGIDNDMYSCPHCGS